MPIVASVELVGIVVLSKSLMRSPLSCKLQINFLDVWFEVVV